MSKWQRIKQQIPMRIIKSGIAVALAYVTMPLFISGTQFYASMGALRTMRESIAGSIQIIIQQLIANFVGFAFAAFFGFIFGINIFSVSLGIMALFLVIKYAKLGDSYLMAGVTLMSIMLLATDDATLVQRGFDRFISTGYGMIIAFIVNIAIFRPKFSNDIEMILTMISEKIDRWFASGSEKEQSTIFNQLSESTDQLESKIGLIRQDMRTKLATRNDKRLQHKIFATIMNSTRQELRIIKALGVFERDEYGNLYTLIHSLFVIEHDVIIDIFAMESYRHYWELIIHDTQNEIYRLMQDHLVYTDSRFNDTVALMHALTIYFDYLSTMMTYVRSGEGEACEWTQSISLPEIEAAEKQDK